MSLYTTPACRSQPQGQDPRSQKYRVELPTFVHGPTTSLHWLSAKRVWRRWHPFTSDRLRFHGAESTRMRLGGFSFLHTNLTLHTPILHVTWLRQQTPIVLCQNAPEPTLVVPDPQTRTLLSEPGEAKADVQLKDRMGWSLFYPGTGRKGQLSVTTTTTRTLGPPLPSSFDFRLRPNQVNGEGASEATTQYIPDPESSRFESLVMWHVSWYAVCRQVLRPLGRQVRKVAGRPTSTVSSRNQWQMLRWCSFSRHTQEANDKRPKLWINNHWAEVNSRAVEAKKSPKTVTGSAEFTISAPVTSIALFKLKRVQMDWTPSTWHGICWTGVAEVEPSVQSRSFSHSSSLHHGHFGKTTNSPYKTSPRSSSSLG
jgi:hypothetical protein